MSNSITEWHPKCPYLSCIGEKYIQCTLHCKIKNNKSFVSCSNVHKFADDICFKDFDKCYIYHEIYAEEMASTDKWILDYRKCVFCCNNSGYTGLKNNCGSTHSYCQMQGIEVEKYNPSIVCGWFNKKAGSKINNMFDILSSFVCSYRNVT